MANEDDDTTADDIVNIIENVSGMIEENKEVVDKVAGIMGMSDNKDTVSIAEMDKLSEMRSNENMVQIVAETKMGEVGSIGLTKKENKIEIDLGEKSIVANDVPQDLDIGEADATLNNGVMTVTIPRTGDVNSSVTDKEGDL